ncbi:MAG: hypothetical protein RRC34_08865 [Lentisphaeria bacterium]|nr:hypothetical protein [Lentisphaeria bacterium]
MSTMISAADRGVIRDLALRYRELCDGERNRAALARWRALNNLKSERPLVFCNVFHLLPEIDPHLPEPRVADERLCPVERWFQRALWTAELDDDRFFDPWFTVRATMLEQPEGLWGVKPDCVHDDASRGWRNLSVLRRMEDLDRLKATPHRVLDPDPPLARMAEDIFGDILPVHRNRVSVYHIWEGVIGPAAGALFGLEELMLALYENPDMVHRFMAFARDGIIANYKQCEAAGDWSAADYWYYNTPPHCDALPDPRPGVHGARLKELVGFCHSQEFESVSPAMFEEFLLDYQRPILELFGRVSYGCCDTLDRKLDSLARLPNLTKITAGPLADPARYPEPFGDRAVISWRPLTTLMVSDQLDEEALRKLFRDGFDKLKGCQVELHMHDLMTIRGDIPRVFRWARIAMEEASRVM